MGYKQNNPLPMMKSALKMEKAMRKSGMHRESAMYMGHKSPAEMGHSPMEMGHSPMEMGHESPAKKESRELKDMPIVDIEKGDAKGSPAKNMDHDKMEGKEKFDHMMVHHPAKPPKGGDPKKGSPAKAAKPDYIDIDGDGDKNESMKEAAKDKKKGSPAKKFDRVVFGGNKGDKSKTKPGKKDFEKKGSPANMKRGSKDEKSGEKYSGFDRVVLGGNKGDKSKTKPGKKDYEGKGSPAKADKMSKKQAREHARVLRTAEGKATKKDERKNKRDTKKTMRHVKKHGSGLIMD